MCPGDAVWRGTVERTPVEPDGLLYMQCRRCRQYMVYEIIAPLPEEKAA